MPRKQKYSPSRCIKWTSRELNIRFADISEQDYWKFNKELSTFPNQRTITADHNSSNSPQLHLKQDGHARSIVPGGEALLWSTSGFEQWPYPGDSLPATWRSRGLLRRQQRPPSTYRAEAQCERYHSLYSILCYYAYHLRLPAGVRVLQSRGGHRRYSHFGQVPLCPQGRYQHPAV